MLFREAFSNYKRSKQGVECALPKHKHKERFLSRVWKREICIAKHIKLGKHTQVQVAL